MIIPKILWVAIPVLIVAMFIHNRLQHLVYNRSIKHGVNQHRLYDVGIRIARVICQPLRCYTEKISTHLPVDCKIQRVFDRSSGFNDISVKLFIVTAGVGLIWYNKLTVLAKAMFSIAFLLCARGVFFNLTLLPTPNKERKISMWDGGSNDLMFSGHYMFITVTCYIIWNHLPFHMAVKWFFVLMGFGVMPLLSLSAKCHYTIDIVVSMCISYLVAQKVIGGGAPLRHI